MQELKEKGNEFFKRGEHAEACKLYTQAIDLAERDPASDRTQLHLIYSNRAASELSLEKFEDALKDCEKVLEIDPKFLKGYLRKALAYKGLGQFAKALETAEAGLAIEKNPKVVAVPELINLVKALRGELKRKLTRKSEKETQELMNDYNEVVGEVEQLNFELETRDRNLKSMKLTLDYLKQVQESTGQAPKTYLPVGRLFILRDKENVSGDLETKITQVTSEFSVLQQKMKLSEAKLKALSNELEELMKYE